MPRSTQRIAIARILSDLIKSDSIIEQVEIDVYNKVISDFGISNDELVAAQNITLSQAMNDAKGLTSDDKKQLRDSLIETANADNACVAREALIMLTLNLVLDDEDDKYELLSYDTHGSYTNDKYVIYIEGDEYPTINEEILTRYEHITNLLKLWKFDFIYLPKVAERFQTMDADYIKNIIHYMNPRLTGGKIDVLYNKLIHIDTSSFVRDFLANDRRQTGLIDTDPALLINIGTSVVPYCQQNEEGHTYTEFLKIRLNTEEVNCVLEEMRRFLSRYQDILTEPEYYRPDRRKDIFKYFGFYKTLFDFLSRIESNGEDTAIVINPTARTISMQGIDIPMSGTELATYMLILWETLYSKHEGLLKITRLNKENFKEKDDRDITRLYTYILRYCRDEPYTQTYQTDFSNIKSYVSRIRKKIQEKIRARDVGHYLPQDNENCYKITINPDNIFIIEDNNKIHLSQSQLFTKFA